MSNHHAHALFVQAQDQPERIGCQSKLLYGGHVLDAGIACRGSLQAGLLLARLCVGDRARISLESCDFNVFSSHQSVFVQTDDPLVACLGCQYAGWPVQSDDFFAMGSGPMRLVRGREQVLQEFALSEVADSIVGILESDKLPTQSAMETMATQCGMGLDKLHLAVAPSTSIAGSLQVVARSVETAMHKLHEVGFDVTSIVSATGSAPLPPPAKPGDTVQGIGRTNDAMLYGAAVALWVDQDDAAIEAIIQKVPSNSSRDHGRPFAKVFKQYDYDFYKVDRLLFSPAVVTIHNLRSGRTWTAGKMDSAILRQSFLS